VNDKPPERRKRKRRPADPERGAEYYRRYMERHPGRKAELGRIWRARNPHAGRAYRAKYRKAHPERARESEARYNKDHRERRKEQVKTYRLKNLDKVRRWKKAHYLRNKKLITARTRVWRKRNPDKLRHYSRASHLQIQLGRTPSASELETYVRGISARHFSKASRTISEIGQVIDALQNKTTKQKDTQMATAIQVAGAENDGAEDNIFRDIVSAYLNWEKDTQTFANLYVKAIDTFRGMRARLRKELPQISAQAWETFENIGRKVLYAPLVMDHSPGAQKLLSLPYDQQVKYHKRQVPIVTLVGENFRTVTKPLQELTRSEAAQVFTLTGLRPEEEQKSMLRSKAQGEHFTLPSYEIFGNKIRFRANVEMTKSQLEAVLRSLRD
jgi:hypothetical protein